MGSRVLQVCFHLFESLLISNTRIFLWALEQTLTQTPLFDNLQVRGEWKQFLAFVKVNLKKGICSPIPTGYSHEPLNRSSGGSPSDVDRFRYRTRYFTDSGIIGTKEFVSRVYQGFKGHFSSRHEKCPKPIQGLNGIYSIKELCESIGKSGRG